MGFNIKIFNFIHSQTFKTYLFFLTAVIGFFAALWGIGLVVSLILLTVATVGFIIFVVMSSRYSNQYISEFKNNLEKIFSDNTSSLIKAKELILDLIKIRQENINDLLEFESLSFNANIDKKGNYFGSYRAKGFNANTSVCESLKIRKGSGSWEIRNLQAYDNLLKEDRKIASFRTDEKAEIYTFEILFQHPLSQSENFDVSWSFELPHAVATDKDDADYFMLWPYKKITGQVEINITFMFNPKSVRLYYIDKKFNIDLYSEDYPNKNYYDKKSKIFLYSIRIKKPALYYAFILLYQI